MILQKINKFIDSTLIDLGRQFRWSYLPPLMVYVAAGISGLTGIVGTFFLKEKFTLLKVIATFIIFFGVALLKFY